MKNIVYIGLFLAILYLFVRQSAKNKTTVLTVRDKQIFPRPKIKSKLEGKTKEDFFEDGYPYPEYQNKKKTTQPFSIASELSVTSTYTPGGIPVSVWEHYKQLVANAPNGYIPFPPQR